MEKTLSTSPSLSEARPPVLQRQCACGNHIVAGGECAECRKKRLQRKATNHDEPGTVHPIVHEVLRSPGHPLDPATRAFMEPRFGHDFSQVRVHTDWLAAQSAQMLNARAYTVGHDIVFAHGQFSPHAIAGQRLIAHELTHVVQQSGQPFTGSQTVSYVSEPAEIEAARFADTISVGNFPAFRPRNPSAARLMRDGASTNPTFGTAKTTAPVARLSPRSEMLKELTDEVTLLNNAQVIIDWAAKQEAAKSAQSGSPGSDPSYFSFSPETLFAEKAVLKKLKPAPKTADDLAAILELLVYYDVITVPIYPRIDATEPEHLLRIDPKTKQPNTSRFAEAKQKVETFTKRFEQRAKSPSPLDPVAKTELLPTEMAAGSKAERQPEIDAQTELTALEQQLAVLEQSGASDEASQKRQLELQAKITRAKEKLRVAGGYRTFASPVVNLLKRLRQINTSWKAGTYVGHSWGEFSADVFLSANLIMVNDADEYSGQYWDRTVVRKFLDDLNTVAEEDDPQTGKFAWRAIYNDKPLAVEINKKFGAGRVVHVENHGPAPDHKLHIHLDLRPINLQWDEKRGYRKKDGRVEIL